jgi:ABC-type nickel/cobalt efflux system permease component RcnA
MSAVSVGYIPCPAGIAKVDLAVVLGDLTMGGALVVARKLGFYSASQIGLLFP